MINDGCDYIRFRLDRDGWRYTAHNVHIANYIG